MAYELIETIELTSSAASIEFTSIPQDGTDLIVLINVRSSGASAVRSFNIRLSGDTSANYDYVQLRGTGSAASSTSQSGDSSILSGYAPGSTATSDTFNNSVIYISNYTSSVAKSVSIDAVSENNATEAWQNLIAGLWDNTSAVTSLLIREGTSSNFVEGSTASLYKITAA